MSHPIHTFTVRAAAVVLASSSLVLAQWTQRFPATSPSARFAPAMTFDFSSASVLLFGGGAPFVNGETWTYDGNNWTQQTPATSPTPRWGAQLVYDTLRGVSVLYGGLATNISIPPPNNDTWEYDGTTWAQATPTANAGPRYWYGACYDSLRSRTVIYGGSTSQLLGSQTNQTWEYDGTTWVQIVTSGNPGALERPAMCFHPVLGKAVLFGGSGPGGPSNQTWLYDGLAGTWTQVTIPGSKPSARNAASMVYDPVRNLCVLAGGQDTSGALSDAWTFDGTAWTQQPSMMESVRDLALTFLPTIGKTVKFGGRGGPNSAQTWEFGSGVLGFGCPGSNGTPVLSQSGAPLLGQNWTVNLTNLNPSFSAAVLFFGFTPLPGIDLGPYPGMPGCFLFTTLDASTSVSGAGGSASWSWPSVGGLVGDDWFVQAGCFDPGINTFNATVSNAIFSTIGP